MLKLDCKCSHGIYYNNRSVICIENICYNQSRLIVYECKFCSFHDTTNYIYLSQLYIYIYRQLLNVEYLIITDQSDVKKIFQALHYILNLIHNLRQIQDLNRNLILKCQQIRQELEQSNFNFTTNYLIEFWQIIESEIQLNKINSSLKSNDQHLLIEHDCEAYNIVCASISPDDQLLVYCTIEYLYVYDLSQKQILKIYKVPNKFDSCFFSQNSFYLYTASYAGQLYKFRARKLKLLLIRQICKSDLQLINIQNHFAFLLNFDNIKNKFIIKYDLKTNKIIYQIVTQYQPYFDLEYHNRFKILFFKTNLIYIWDDQRRKCLFSCSPKRYRIIHVSLLQNGQLLALHDGDYLQIWRVNYKKQKLVTVRTVKLKFIFGFKKFNNLSDYLLLFTYEKVSKREKYCSIIDREGRVIQQNKYSDIVLKVAKYFDKFKQSESLNLFMIIDQGCLQLMYRTK